MTRPPRAVPTMPWFPVRELLLTILPSLLTVIILLVGYLPVRADLERTGNLWTSYPYESIVNSLFLYHLDREDPRTPTARLDSARQQIESSLRNPAEFQFPPIQAVEAHGPARLQRVRALFATGRERDLHEAIQEAIRLNVQAHEYIIQLREVYVGQLRRVQWYMLGAALASGLMGVLLTGRLLQRWQRERRARDAEARDTQHMLAMASHELRRPLQKLLLVSDLLRDSHTRERQQELLELLEDAAVQVASRSDLARLEDLFSDTTLDLKPTDLRTLISPFVGPRVYLTLPPLPVVRAVDTRRIRQAIENLVENALKHTRTLVQVELHAHRDVTEIHVVDDGAGLSEEVRARAFEAFYRAPGQSNPGRGLGLTIARQFARAHGGDVDLIAEPGGGTRAILRLGSMTRVP
ncbi:sensor histidine kinase [Deinococcus maricopensis]|uniref:histidine kinase n=1 Tax=Deinococcus maricopensis (strain DSM 21211 / LMG 22137 / NRRL B-23946 / LB-34) TaxID=709986 RepID=E8U566_DEIML|nr:HAMP domain-containing sensor histidine kinase [Deinococcus maricopensis]ADV66205.1 integral membrane sensor signal transduction histidine kinase [Deinococcus maricopensis DSM 21211]